MGTAERRKREKAQRRRSIIDAAESVFFAKGLTTATMDEVATEAELSKGTLYLYFKSKEDLYLGIIERALTMLRVTFEKAVAGQERGIDKVAAIGRAYFVFCREHKDYANALLYFDSYAGPEGRESFHAAECMRLSNELFTLCAAAVQTGIDDGSIRTDVDPMKVAVTLYGLSTGLLQVIAIKGKLIEAHHGVDPNELIDTFFELIYESLRAGGGREEVTE